MKQFISEYAEKTELILALSADDLKPYIKAFLYQLYKIKKISNKLLLSDEGRMLTNQISKYFDLLNEHTPDRDELFVQLLTISIKSVLIAKANNELHRLHYGADLNAFHVN